MSTNVFQVNINIICTGIGRYRYNETSCLHLNALQELRLQLFLDLKLPKHICILHTDLSVLQALPQGEYRYKLFA